MSDEPTTAVATCEDCDWRFETDDVTWDGLTFHVGGRKPIPVHYCPNGGTSITVRAARYAEMLTKHPAYTLKLKL